MEEQMKNSTIYLLTLVFLMSLTFPIFAQAPDTVWVELDDYSENYTLTETIEGDTTATGERNNPNRVYGLRNGGWYYLTGRVRNIGYHLQLTGEERSAELHPPVVLMNIDEAGESDNPMFEASGDISVRNIYFLCTDALGAVTKRVIVAFVEGVTVKADNCIFEYGHQTIYTDKPGVSVFATNNLVRNLMEIGPKSTNYRFFIQTKKISSDTIWIENNTFLNCPGAPLAVSTVKDGQQNYFHYVHNTVVNSSCQTFHFAYWGNATFKNNIWYSALSMGDAESQRAKQLSDAHVPFSIIQVDTIGSDEIMPEADRVINISNNAWFVPNDILQMQADSSHKTSPISLITDRGAGMFADKETWPGLSYDTASIYNEDPGFINEPDKRSEFVEFNASFLSKPYPTIDNFFDSDWLGEDVEPFAFTWPISDDLSYTNAKLLTGSDDGTPLGDLNWFPDITSVVDESEFKTVTSFELNQNYPNPFNPSTTINYYLQKAGQVKLTVYNVKGQKVKTLVDNKKINSGHHSVTFNGDALSSGVYFYKLESGKNSLMKKMLLVK